VTNTFNTPEEYFAAFDGLVSERLSQLRALVKATIPDVTEKISYNIPAYFVDGRPVVYIAGYKQHVSIYPFHELSDKDKERANAFLSGRATFRINLTDDIPADLVTSLVRTRLALVRKSK
jgi:uncharacterized protein YdhG (YjbR/CyaY superfamily)